MPRKTTKPAKPVILTPEQIEAQARRNAAADAYVAARINTLYIYARDARDTDLMALCIDARNGSDSAINEVGSFITDNRSALSELFDVF